MQEILSFAVETEARMQVISSVVALIVAREIKKLPESQREPAIRGIQSVIGDGSPLLLPGNKDDAGQRLFYERVAERLPLIAESFIEEVLELID